MIALLAVAVTDWATDHIGNENEPKIIINGTVFFS